MAAGRLSTSPGATADPTATDGRALGLERREVAQAERARAALWSPRERDQLTSWICEHMLVHRHRPGDPTRRPEKAWHLPACRVWAPGGAWAGPQLGWDLSPHTVGELVLHPEE